MAPIELHLFVNNYEEWGYKCIGSEEDSKNFSNQVNGDQARYPPPPGYKYKDLMFPFKWCNYKKCMKLKKFTGVVGNVLDLEEWMEHPIVEPLITDPDVVYSIVYFNKLDGKEITEDQAFEACRSMDPSKKPPSNRPGKRPAPSSGPPDTPSKSTKPATSE